MAKSNPEKSLTYFEEQLIFYGSYHHNVINILVHIVCVPLILWSLEVGLAKFGSLTSLSLLFFDLKVNLPLLVSWLYAGYYISLDPIAGAIYFPLLTYIAYSSTNFNLMNSNSGTIASIVQTISWVAQFAAHAFAEKRAPALFDSLTQAITLAPFFVFLEVLFFFGYRKELQQKVNAAASKNIGDFIAGKLKQKRTAS